MVNNRKRGRPKKITRSPGSGRGNTNANKNVEPPLLCQPIFTGESEEECTVEPPLLCQPIFPGESEEECTEGIFIDDFDSDLDYGENIILTASSLIDLIEDNLCSKEYVSSGMSTLLNQFALVVQEHIKKS